MNLIQLPHEGNSCAPIRCKQYSFDVNQQAQSLNAWEQKYNQHGAGQFHGYLDEIKLPGLHLFEEFTSHTVHQECSVNPNAIWIGFSMDTQRPKVNGLQAAPHQLMIRPAQQHFELATPDDFHIFGVVIDRDLLLENIQCDDKQQWESTSLLKNLNPQHGCWSLVELIRQVLDTESVLGKRLLQFSSGQSPSGTLPSGQAPSGQLSQGQSSHGQAALQQMLASAVIDRLGQFAVSEHNEARSYTTRRQALLRLYRHLDNNGDYPMSVAEMASIACVSQRTLQYCFEQELGVSPIAFLRECRLNAVRRALIVTDQEKTIGELALQHGFYHLGTFNQYYKLLFGETPSQTRDRADRYERAALVKRFTPQR